MKKKTLFVLIAIFLSPCVFAEIEKNVLFEQVRELIEKEKDLSSYTLLLNSKNNQGYTHLHLSILNNDLKTFKKLVKAGADTLIRTPGEDLSALELALKKKNQAMIEFLFKVNMDTHFNQVIHMIGKKGMSEEELKSRGLDVEKLVKSGIINVNYNYGEKRPLDVSFLDMSIAVGNLKEVKFLVKHGAFIQNFALLVISMPQPHDSDKHRKDMIEVVRYLVKTKTLDFKGKDKEFGERIFEKVSSNGEVEMARELISLGVDIKKPLESKRAIKIRKPSPKKLNVNEELILSKHKLRACTQATSQAL